MYKKYYTNRLYWYEDKAIAKIALKELEKMDFQIIREEAMAEKILVIIEQQDFDSKMHYEFMRELKEKWEEPRRKSEEKPTGGEETCRRSQSRGK